MAKRWMTSCGFRVDLNGIPVVRDGLGDAAELDDGEFGGELAFEGVDGAADFGEGHGSTSDGGVTRMKGTNGMEPPDVDLRQDWVLGWDDGGKLRNSAHSLSFPVI